jgi:hypothetical protein
MCCRTTPYDNGSAVKIRYIMMGRSVRVNNRMDPFPSMDLLILNGTLLRIFDLNIPGGSCICIYVKAIIQK